MASQADTEKEQGNAEYKKKNFTEAIAHYDNAIKLDPNCITYYSNKAAALFEMGDFENCISLCEQGIEIGRENRAPYESVAKALARIAHCYEKKGDLVNARKFYDKSLSERRVPAIEKKSKELAELLKQQESLAYVNPELAEQEKTKGNEHFQAGRFPEALKSYTEAIRRNPKDPKIYSNRAACYTKLMEFRLALRDCDTCIKLDPKFIKGYLRKGAACVALKEFTQAKKAFREALELDPECAEARQGLMQSFDEDNDPEAARQRAMNNPEVIEILSDPTMRLILNQMEQPGALREHLNNPEIATKLSKLIDAGLISFR